MVLKGLISFMIILLGFIVLLACLIVGVRYGGLGLAAISGLGLAFFVFVIGLVPGKPPIDVMLTIMAVVTCSGFLQASKGLDVMLVYAEKLLRKNPKQITILAPITTWFLTVLCGTGHVVYCNQRRYSSRTTYGCIIYCFSNGGMCLTGIRCSRISCRYVGGC